MVSNKEKALKDSGKWFAKEPLLGGRYAVLHKNWHSGPAYAACADRASGGGLPFGARVIFDCVKVSFNAMAVRMLDFIEVAKSRCSNTCGIGWL